MSIKLFVGTKRVKNLYKALADLLLQ